MIPVKTILGESVGEIFEGQIAVGKVIRERARRSGKTFDEVCLAPKQFSFWNRGQEDGDEWLEKNTTSVQMDVANLAWQRSEVGFKNWATHYHAIGFRPYWAESMKRVAQIGRHVFYLESIK